MLESLRSNRRIPKAGEQAQTLVEYSLMISLIAIGALAGIMALGGSEGTLYETVKKAAEAMSGVLS